MEVWAHLLPGGSQSGEWIAEQPGLNHSVMRWWCMAVSLSWLKIVDFKDTVFQSRIESCLSCSKPDLKVCIP